MILTKLLEYYEREAAAGRAPRYGWEKAKVNWALELDENGTPLRLLPLNEKIQRGKKSIEVAKTMEVPQQATKTSGILPGFLCDSAEYILGIPKNDTAKGIERTAKCHKASCEKHIAILSEVNTPTAKAIVQFFTNFNLTKNEQICNIENEIPNIKSSDKIIFRCNDHFAEDDIEIQNAWGNHFTADSDNKNGICLITGEKAPIAPTHPMIQGIKSEGVQPSGAALVSFNKISFESYGKEGAQNLNAPVSKYAAFAYTTALNMLIADSAHSTRIGDTTVIYWAEQNNAACQDIFSLYALGKEDNTITDTDIHAFFEHIKKGQSFSYKDINISFDNPFYILGIAANKARLSVRFFLSGMFGSFLLSALHHQERMDIIRPKFNKNSSITLLQMLNETVKPQSRDHSASPLLAGAVLRALLTDSPYPTALYENILLRVHAEHDEHKINFRRAAIIKAYLIKNKRRNITVSLDETSKNPAYVLGRLFAVLEDIQKEANPGIQATIKDRYFNSACSTPALVFPVLQKLSQHHLKKLSEKFRVYFEIQIGHIMDLLPMQDEPLPRRLSLEEQGIFILGYYHQRQKFFAGKKKTTDETEDK